MRVHGVCENAREVPAAFFGSARLCTFAWRAASSICAINFGRFSRTLSALVFVFLAGFGCTQRTSMAAIRDRTNGAGGE